MALSLPEHIHVVAFPSLAQAPDGAGTTAPTMGTAVASLLLDAPCSAVSVRGYDRQWLTVVNTTKAGKNQCWLNIFATDNPARHRQTPLCININASTYQLTVCQFGGQLVQTEMVQVLNSPLNTDCLIAIGFIAEQLQKVEPPPIQLLVALLVILIIIVISIVVATIRHLFADIPEPPPLSLDTLGKTIDLIPGLGIPGLLPLPGVPATDQLIGLQTIKEIYWLIQLTLSSS